MQTLQMTFTEKREMKILTSVLLTLYVAEMSTGLPANDISLSPCFGARARPGVNGKLHAEKPNQSGARRNYVWERLYG